MTLSRDADAEAVGVIITLIRMVIDVCVEVTRGTSKCDGGFKDERPTGKEREKQPASNQPPTLHQRNTRPQTQNSRLQGICLRSRYLDDYSKSTYLEELLCLEKEFVRGERRRRRAPRGVVAKTRNRTLDRRHHTLALELLP